MGARPLWIGMPFAPKKLLSVNTAVHRPAKRDNMFYSKRHHLQAYAGMRLT